MANIDERLKKLEADAAAKRAELEAERARLAKVADLDAELENLRAAKSVVQEQIDEVDRARDKLIRHPKRGRKVAP